MKKLGNKLPVKSQMVEQDEDDVRPAKKVMQAIGKSVLNPKKAKTKAPKVPNGPSSQKNKQNRKDIPEMSKDADDQE